MREELEKKPSKSAIFRSNIKDICSYIRQDIENTAERKYIERKYKNLIKDYRERTRRIKNICSGAGKNP